MLHLLEKRSVSRTWSKTLADVPEFSRNDGRADGQIAHIFFPAHPHNQAITGHNLQIIQELFFGASVSS